MVSTKMCFDYDANIDLNDWAEYGEISVETLKRLELEFLSALVSVNFNNINHMLITYLQYIVFAFSFYYKYILYKNKREI